jgi:putative ABC transport system ATP-binding protein
LFGLNTARGTTLVLITHDTELAARCHRQIRMADGKIIEDRIAA